MNAAQAIDVITEAARGEDRIRALYLSGSHATGLQDDYSDLDFLLVTPDGASDDISALWKRLVLETGPLVMWRDRIVRPALINAITENWLRIDAVLLPPEQMATYAKDSLRVLFDRDGLHKRLGEKTGSASDKPPRAGYQFEEFIRILGLLAVAIGRQDFINGVTGVMHLRSLLIELMIEENAAPHRGGALHPHRLLSEEQKAVLVSLPVPKATRAAVIQAHLAYAGIYLPRARRLAKTWGVTWPERFEAATWAHLRKTLALEAPDPDA